MNDYGYNCLRRENIGWTGLRNNRRELGEDEVEVQVTDVDGDRYVYGIRPDELMAFREWVGDMFGPYWVRDEHDYMIAGDWMANQVGQLLARTED